MVSKRNVSTVARLLTHELHWTAILNQRRRADDFDLPKRRLSSFGCTMSHTPWIICAGRWRGNRIHLTRTGDRDDNQNPKKRGYYCHCDSWFYLQSRNFAFRDLNSSRDLACEEHKLSNRLCPCTFSTDSEHLGSKGLGKNLCSITRVQKIDTTDQHSLDCDHLDDGTIPLLSWHKSTAKFRSISQGAVM
mmetsp:Transcript_59622/g.122255  ORF Transcript_59622/g.122255 Transcript_59622/m.122255 type:complete len:190 (+) Transcript_59622:222-791(+)